MHLNLTRRKPQFALDPDAARVFLAEALRRWEHENISDSPGEPNPYGDGWTLAPDWDLDKLFRDDLDHVAYLVNCAVNAGAIICPPGLDLDLIITANDYGDWMYDWRVSFDYPSAQFALCMPYRHEFKQLGSSDPLGDPKGKASQNAWWVLNEAIEEANRILGAYLQAHGRLGPPRRTVRETVRRWAIAARVAAWRVANHDA